MDLNIEEKNHIYAPENDNVTIDHAMIESALEGELGDLEIHPMSNPNNHQLFLTPPKEAILKQHRNKLKNPNIFAQKRKIGRPTNKEQLQLKLS